MARVWIGSSSWSEKAWAGTFYPVGVRPADYLTYYATRFPAVEADTTYYRVPSRALVAGWDRKTPAGFRLCAKFPRSIVHGGEGPEPDADRILDAAGQDTAEFLETMGLLGTKCGPLVLQFPYFNRRAFGEVEPFLERLDGYLARLPDGFRYAVELRNKSWIGEPLLEVLRAHGVALCLVDLAYLPHPHALAGGLNLCTTDFVYARLIGDRKAVDKLTRVLDHVVIDQSRRLEKWGELIADLAPQVTEVFAFCNNHYAGFAPQTVADLVRVVEERGLEVEKVVQEGLFPE